MEFNHGAIYFWLIRRSPSVPICVVTGCNIVWMCLVPSNLSAGKDNIGVFQWSTGIMQVTYKSLNMYCTAVQGQMGIHTRELGQSYESDWIYLGFKIMIDLQSFRDRVETWISSFSWGLLRTIQQSDQQSVAQERWIFCFGILQGR